MINNILLACVQPLTWDVSLFNSFFRKGRAVDRLHLIYLLRLFLKCVIKKSSPPWIHLLPLIDLPMPFRNDAAVLSNEGSDSVVITCECMWIKSWWVRCCEVVDLKMSRRNQPATVKAPVKAPRAKRKNFEIYHIMLAVIVSNFLNQNIFF